MNSENDERLARLPKWAQAEILRGRADSAALAELRAGGFGPEDTDTIAGIYGSKPMRLPKGEDIEFRLGDGQEQVIRASVDGDKLKLFAGAAIIIHPRSGNYVEVAAGKI